MEIKISDENSITLFEILGKLDTNTAPEAETKVNEIVESDCEKLLIDLKETTFVSSDGLRVFLATSKKMTAKGNSLVFCCPNEVVQEVFDISGFASILSILPTREKAIEELQ